MQRDLSIVKALLEFIESEDTGRGIYIPHLDGFGRSDLEYHHGLCLDGGLIREVEGEEAGDDQRPRLIAIRLTSLTWEGHNQLDFLRTVDEDCDDG